MEKKSSNIKYKIFVPIITISFFLLVLLGYVVGANQHSYYWGIAESKETDVLNATYKWAAACASDPEMIFNMSVSDIFKWNQYGPSGTANNGIYGNNRWWTTDYSREDICYPSAMCIYHSQGSSSLTYSNKITNVIDINVPGITQENWNVKVYGQNGTSKSWKIQDATGTNGEKDTTEREYMTAFAYLLNKSTETATTLKNQGEPLYSTEGKTVTPLKTAILHLWINNADQTSVFYYLNQRSGGMLNLFMEGYTANSNTYDSEKKYQVEVDEAYEEARKILVEPTVQKINEGVSAPQITHVGNKAYIGPIKVSYAGGDTKIKIYNGTTWIEADGWARRENGAFSETQTGNIVNNTPVYAVVSESKLGSKPISKLKVELNYTSYKARVILTSNVQNKAQNLMFYVGQNEKNIKQVEWEVTSQNADVSIKKVDSSGNPLAGIIFEIYNAKNEKVKDLTTKADGTTEKIELQINKVYQIRETKTGIYGYGNPTLEGKISISNGEITKVQGNAANFKVSADSVITIKNEQTLGDVTIAKKGANDKNLSNVSFVVRLHTYAPAIAKDYYKYLKLYKNENGKDVFVPEVTGDITINSNNIATTKDGKIQYKVEYIEIKEDISKWGTDKLNQITRFITGSNGKITIHNLEKYSNTSNTKFDYTFCEVGNENFGYKAETKSGKSVTAYPGDPEKVINNTSQLGAIKLQKVENYSYDGKENVIKVNNVGFVVENYIKYGDKKYYSYLRLYENKDGKDVFVSEVTGDVIINSDNIATTKDGKKEYKVEYKHFDGEIQYKNLTAEQKAQITKFITDAEGKLSVSNLEIYAQSGSGNVIDTGDTKKNYQYKLIEVDNPHYGYHVGSIDEQGKIINASTERIRLQTGETANLELKNTQEDTKISGYVWVEDPSGKDNGYDLIYGTNSEDIKLTDLYIRNESGELVTNESAQIKVAIKLMEKSTGRVIKEKPDEFDAKTGEYTFNDVEVEELENYKVVFEYDGFKYTSVIPNLNAENTSKVSENTAQRQDLNNKFGTVTEGGKLLSNDGDNSKEENKITYTTTKFEKTEKYEAYQTSQVNNIPFAIISADTDNAKYNLAKEYSELKIIANKPTTIIDNVNMGLVFREQPDLSISEDIEKVTVTLNGYNYDYIYNTRYQYLENSSGFDVGVKFENQYSNTRYSSTIYASDIKALSEGNAKLGVQIKYNITIKNQSYTLSMEPKQIVNYFDSRYTIENITLAGENTGKLTNADGYRIEDTDNENYKKVIIGYEGKIGPGEQRTIEILFNVSDEAIIDLLNQKSTYYNATEILSYATYYGNNTAKQLNKEQKYEYYATEQGEVGAIYAGIDQDSAPGNMAIELDSSTGKLKTDTFEDDTESAPSLVLEAGNVRAISGNVWEDIDHNKEDKEILGNGILDSKENPVGNMKVELWQIVTDENGNTITQLAKYSDGSDAVTTTTATGEYRFGKLDKDKKEYIGILPGTYFIKYVYNNETYVVEPSGNKNISILDYKSTIITSDIIKSAINTPENAITFNEITYPGDRWYLIKEEHRYSDANDNWDARQELENNEITNATYSDIANKSMYAQTPLMDIGIEFTSIDSAPAMFFDDKGDLIAQQFVSEFTNVDFGIIKRGTDITIEKKITGLEIVAQNGTNIVPKADPSTGERIQYVKTGIEGLVPAEIDSNLLQGAELELEYSITVTNNSPIDYKEDSYYYYGTGGETLKESGVELVADYLDSTIKLDSNKDNSSWDEATADTLFDEGLISEDVYNQLKSGKYTILLTDEFKEVQTGESKTVKLHTSKFLAVSDEIKIDNRVEIIKLSGGRTIQDSTPGNLIPEPLTGGYGGYEKDSSTITFVITPPTGTTVNYVAYIIAISAMLLIVTMGIIVIKKKVVKKL